MLDQLGWGGAGYVRTFEKHTTQRTPRSHLGWLAGSKYSRNEAVDRSSKYSRNEAVDRSSKYSRNEA
eukprot:208538-Chlamydomonas_euryale.AAC.1